jgi:hypothetical protein
MSYVLDVLNSTEAKKEPTHAGHGVEFPSKMPGIGNVQAVNADKLSKGDGDLRFALQKHLLKMNSPEARAELARRAAMK